MNTSALLAVSCALLCSAFAAPSDQEVEARNRALLLADAFSNDGFKIRDGNWSGEIKPGQAKIIQVNLYAGNDYWFSAAGTDPAKKLALTIYDESGAPLKAEPYDEIGKVAAGFSPTASGTYFIKLQEVEGEPAAFCLLYSYK